MNKQDHSGRTALMYCFKYGGIHQTLSLITSGCNLNLKDNEGRTYVDWIKKLNPSVVEKILKWNDFIIKKYKISMLIGLCIIYIDRNKSKFHLKNINILPKDVRDLIEKIEI